MGSRFSSIELIEETIIELASTGVDVMITELDITVIPNPWALAGINRDEFKIFEGDKSGILMKMDYQEYRKN